MTKKPNNFQYALYFKGRSITISGFSGDDTPNYQIFQFSLGETFDAQKSNDQNIIIKEEHVRKQAGKIIIDKQDVGLWGCLGIKFEVENQQIVLNENEAEEGFLIDAILFKSRYNKANQIPLNDHNYNVANNNNAQNNLNSVPSISNASSNSKIHLKYESGQFYFDPLDTNLEFLLPILNKSHTQDENDNIKINCSHPRLILYYLGLDENNVNFDDQNIIVNYLQTQFGIAINPAKIIKLKKDFDEQIKAIITGLILIKQDKIALFGENPDQAIVYDVKNKLIPALLKLEEVYPINEEMLEALFLSTSRKSWILQYIPKDYANKRLYNEQRVKNAEQNKQQKELNIFSSNPDVNNTQNKASSKLSQAIQNFKISQNKENLVNALLQIEYVPEDIWNAIYSSNLTYEQLSQYLDNFDAENPPNKAKNISKINDNQNDNEELELATAISLSLGLSQNAQTAPSPSPHNQQSSYSLLEDSLKYSK